MASAGEAPNIIVDPAELSLETGFTAGEGLGIAVEAGFAAGAALAATGDWPNTMVAPPAGSGLGAGFAASGEVFKLPVWNIIVRPAPSSAGAAAAGFAAAGLAAGAAGLEEADGIAGFDAATGDCPNTIVALGAGSAGFAADFAAAAGAALGAGGAGTCWGAVGSASGLVTLKVFWHFPQRMVRPWGPIRASSTR